MKLAATITQALDGLLYADAFDCALTLEEIHRFSRIRTTKDQLLSWLESPSLSSFISQESDYYYLCDRRNIVAQRSDNIARARKLRQRAIRIARWVQLLPFVRGVVLTGSVAANDADSEADIDFLVIVAESRISFGFFMLGGLSRLSSRRLFCPNYYLSETSLLIQRRDVYVAREISQAIPLTGKAHDFFVANDWVEQELPNGALKTNYARPIMSASIVQKTLEFLCNCILRKGLEVKLKSLAANRLAHHYQLQLLPVPENIKKGFEAGRELRFHHEKRPESALHKYEKNRKALLRHLELSGN